MNKFEFINTLLTNEKFTTSQKERLIKLVAKEVSEFDEVSESIIKDIDQIKRKIGLIKPISFKEAWENARIVEEKNEVKEHNLVKETMQSQNTPDRLRKYLVQTEDNTMSIEKPRALFNDMIQPEKVFQNDEQVEAPNNTGVNEKNSTIIKDIDLINDENETLSLTAPNKEEINLPKYIYPSSLYKFLFKYNQNPILRSTCHEIDSNELLVINNYCGTDSYDFEKHLNKIISEFDKHKKLFAPFPIKNLISGYLKGEDYKGDPITGWSTDEVVFNWSHVELKRYAKENPKVAPNLSLDLLGDYMACEIPQFNSKITFKAIQSFRELVLHFKSLFHIRYENSLFEILLNMNKERKWDEKVEFTINENEFPKNIEHFTDVDKLTQAYNIIIRLIIEQQNKRNPEEKPRIKLLFLEKDNSVELSIYHLNGTYNKSITNTLEKIGQTYSNMIINQINGLCNFYLQADFGNGHYARINIWDGNKMMQKKLESFKGVEHILEFIKK